MIIGVDAGALSITDDRLRVGVYRVVKHALEALASIDKSNDYRLYAFRAIEEGIAEKFEGRALVVQLPKLGWQRVWLPLELKRHPVDAYLGFAQALPSVKTLYDIGFIYDLGFLYEPDAYGGSAGTLKKQTDDLVRRADHIITISHATKADILSHYAKPSFQRAKLGFPTITVAYPGVDAGFSPAGKKYIGARPYFLFVGSLTKTKDIPTLLGAFARFLESNGKKRGSLILDHRPLRRSEREASLRGDDRKEVGDDTRKIGDGDEYDLYLIGGDYWPDQAIEKAIETYHLAGRVKKLGFVPDEALPQYYRGATAFVTTALREGFCLPAAEAMACGTPVVGLDQGALREVVGAGGIVVSQKSCLAGRQAKVKSIKQVFLEAMMEMTNGNTRKVFAKKAIEQAKKFQWKKFGKELLHLLHDNSRKNSG